MIFQSWRFPWSVVADSDFIHVYLFGLHVLTLTHEGVVA